MDGKITEWLKILPRYFFPIAIITGLFLFGPQYLTDAFGLTKPIQTNKIYLSIVFLFSASFVLYDWVTELVKLFRNILQKKRLIKIRNNKLQNLTTDEKIVLQKYIQSKEKVQYFSIRSGTVLLLEHNGILKRATTIGDIFFWPFMIENWAWNYLNKHKNLLVVDENIDKGKIKPIH
ncbi:MAG: super-infection exclusion protein B [Chloroflexota bacterium]